MAYASKQDLQKRLSNAKLVQLTDFANAGSMDEARITEALNAATSLIDSYASDRYVLPLAVSDQVKDLAVGIAVYKLHAGRQMITESVKEDYNRGLALLKDVAAGRASLNQPAALQATELDVKTKDHDTERDVFDEKKLDAF